MFAQCGGFFLGYHVNVASALAINLCGALPRLPQS